MTPLRPRMGKTVTLCVAMTTWLLGIAISFPNFMFYTTYEDESGERVVCYAEWPDGATNESTMEYM